MKEDEFSYENYMNLLFHLDRTDANVPEDIAKRIVSNAIAPVITVNSTPELDASVQRSYGLDSIYMLLRFFGGCVSDRDQAHESQIDKSNHLYPSSNRRQSRKRSNSLFQRDPTLAQYIRFTRSLPDLLNTRDPGDLLFDYHSLEALLENFLKLINDYTDDDTLHTNLKKSVYHRFFSMAISSNTYLSPFETFNHPVMSLLALDVSQNQGYEVARNMLISFKSLENTLPNFPKFVSTNDIMPVFLLCYNKNSEEDQSKCDKLSKQLKKQLFVESIKLPLWDAEYSNSKHIALHQPVMTSIDEMLYFFQSSKRTQIPLLLIESIYDFLGKLVQDLMIPFMRRKIAFWEETILQPRKSLFHGSRFFRKLIDRSSNNLASQTNKSQHENTEDENLLPANAPELLLRKLADWSMMLSDFKTAFTTYESLIRELENHPKYLSSCLEWSAISILMGGQSMVTLKIIKNDVNPLIDRALATYHEWSVLQDNKSKDTSSVDYREMIRSYETRCMLLTSELFLALSDTWTSTPYALTNLENIISDYKLGPCSQIMIWERLSDCYEMRTDPRIKHKVVNNTLPLDSDENNTTNSDAYQPNDIVISGLTRKRKAAFFRLIAAKKWAEQKQWRQVSWCLKDVEDVYDKLILGSRENLVFAKLKNMLRALPK